MRVADLIANKMKASKSFFSPYRNESDLRLEGKFVLAPTLEGRTMLIDLEKEMIIKSSTAISQSITYRICNTFQFLKWLKFLYNLFEKSFK